MNRRLTSRIAEFVAQTSIGSIPDAVRQAAAGPVVDTIGVIIAGSSGEAGRIALQWARANAPRPSEPARWTGAPASLSADLAAMVSSTLGHALDYDDELAGVGHPSSIILSAALALPLEQLSGSQLVEAYSIGYEVNVKVANLLGHRHYRAGFHTTGTVGGFGSAAAAAKLLGLDARQVAVALGIVASLGSGLQRNFGTMTKPLHSGLAARNGVLAAQLAAAGFTASTDILDGERGFSEVYADGGHHPDAIDRLAAPWALLDPGPTLKKYPCCYATHRPIDGALRLQARHAVAPERIGEVIVHAPTFGLRPLIHHNPQTGLQGKFSLEYVLAAALLDREIVLDSFTDAAVRRPAVRSLMSLVNANEEPRCRPEDPEATDSSAGTGGFHEIVLRTTDGESFATTVQHPSGSPHHPLGAPDIEAKFLTCVRAGGRDDRNAGAVLSELQRLEQLADFHTLLSTLNKGA